MLSREDILEIEQYCKEHNISKRQRLSELGIGHSHYYRVKEKYRVEDLERNQKDLSGIGSFIELPSSPGVMQPSSMPVKQTHKCNHNSNAKNCVSSSDNSHIVVEIQTVHGLSMRIQGELTPNHLKELLQSTISSNV